MEKEVSCGFHCIKAKNIGVTIGQDEILKNINLHIHCKELTVVIGRNGAGKTTLLKALLGEVKHTGTIEFMDTKENIARKLKVGYVPQSINVERHMPTTVYDLFAAYISTEIPTARQRAITPSTKQIKTKFSEVKLSSSSNIISPLKFVIYCTHNKQRCCFSS